MFNSFTDFAFLIHFIHNLIFILHSFGVKNRCLFGQYETLSIIWGVNIQLNSNLQRIEFNVFMLNLFINH